ncbi:MAG: hypothetical protein J6Z11_16890, partial [Candidatus Riflebacteria bacterium]|nr:hypothetical protein [Candidatus Riflebacteria bacterium]
IFSELFVSVFSSLVLAATAGTAETDFISLDELALELEETSNSSSNSGLETTLAISCSCLLSCLREAVKAFSCFKYYFLFKRTAFNISFK